MKFIRYYFLVLSGVLLLSGSTFAQKADKSALEDFSKLKANEFETEKSKALQYAKDQNLPVFIETDRSFMELMSIDDDGTPRYYITNNANAAKTSSTDKVHNGGGAGLNLEGQGMTAHEWDGGGIRTTHQELSGRVTQGDSPSSTHYHAQHVAGTIIASGVVASAKGMAPQANLRAFDWNNDESEMATEAANGALVSNHSYGYGNGWVWTGSTWQWYGNTSISTQEDYSFGFYDSQAQDWDQIAYNAPDYLIVKSAGNDRGDGPSNGAYPQDGPYDCLANASTAKNILTVGAVEDIPAGYSQPSDVVMSSFSSWGPCDDSRIKPDIVANGVSVYSTDDDNDSDYQSLSGTSMASPTVTGSLILLQQHYKALNSNANMKAATLKALVINTADEAGSNDGPDYSFGWGLMNTLTAAQKITEDQTLNVIDELTLNNGGNYQREVTAKGGEPIKVTVVWTDKPGTPVAAALDPTDIMLVNDLDLRITEGVNTYYPWKLTAANPSSAATRSGENNVDNVQFVTIDNPTADANYTIVVDHDGTLDGASQAFSIVISGIKEQSGPAAPVANFSASYTNISTGETINFSDLSSNSPTSWSWSFSGGSPSSSSNQNPSVTYNTAGTYQVSLTATNAIGSDTKTINNYITVTDPVISYCASQGNNYSYEWISKVEIGSFTKNSSGSNYSDYTSDIINLSPGVSTSVTLTPAFSSSTYDEYWKIWIDYNGDGDFEDSGEEVFNANGTSAVSGNFTVSPSASGSTRMRVSMKWNANPTSCEQFSYGEVEDYTVNFTTPVAPVAEFSAASTVITAGESIQFSDLSTNTPTSWNWSFTGGTPSSSTSQNPSITYNTAGTYAVSLTVSNAGGSDTETKSAYITVNPAAVSYCSSQGNNSSYEWISQVNINSYTNNSGASGYSDYTSEIVQLNAGSNTVSLSPAFSGTTYVENWKIWIDWNKDGDFTDSGEEVFSPASSSSTVSGSFNTQAGFSGQTRMRISMKWNGTPTSCESFSYGEVEDYTVNYTASNIENELSENNLFNLEILVYPNPSREYFNIQLSESLNAQILVYDMQGKIVMEKELHDGLIHIGTEAFESGIYTLRVLVNDQVFNERLIIQ